jgi:hypothetical protein
MELALSWNLFVLSIFIAVVAYSMIIGLNKTIKTVITSYLALLAADGLGNLTQEYLLDSTNMIKVLNIFGLEADNTTVLVIKITIFLLCIVLLTIKGAFEVHMASERFPALNPFMTLVFGILNSALIVSTGLIFAAGSSFIRANFVETNIADIYSTSSYVQLLVDYHSLWFALPVVIFIVWCLVDHEIEEIE